MDAQMIQEVTQAYREVADQCELDSPRAMPWAAANDVLLLDQVLSDVNLGNDRILDFGCCGWPWITNYLDRLGHNVVGVDVAKPHWFEHDVATELDLQLIGYDGERLPLNDNAFDLVLMFGVLEHVGVWKTDEQKYQERTTAVTDHRRQVLAETERVLNPDGTLYVTKFPNVYGRDKLLAGLLGSDPGHLDSERARPGYLRGLIGERFDIKTVFANGLLPHRIPLETPLAALPLLYAKLDGILSNIPILGQVAQNYCLTATPR